MPERHEALPSTSSGDAGVRVETTPTGLRVIGELDLATAPIVAARLDPLPGGGDVVLDLAGLRFIDSTGLSVLVRAHQQARAVGRRLLLASPTPRLRRLLEITALDDVLLLDEHDEQAGDHDDDAGGAADVTA